MPMPPFSLRHAIFAITLPPLSMPLHAALMLMMPLRDIITRYCHMMRYADADAYATLILRFHAFRALMLLMMILRFADAAIYAIIYYYRHFEPLRFSPLMMLSFRCHYAAYAIFSPLLMLYLMPPC